MWQQPNLPPVRLQVHCSSSSSSASFRTSIVSVGLPWGRAHPFPSFPLALRHAQPARTRVSGSFWCLRPLTRENARNMPLELPRDAQASSVLSPFQGVTPRRLRACCARVESVHPVALRGMMHRRCDERCSFRACRWVASLACSAANVPPACRTGECLAPARYHTASNCCADASAASESSPSPAPLCTFCVFSARDQVAP